MRRSICLFGAVVVSQALTPSPTLAATTESPTKEACPVGLQVIEDPSCNPTGVPLANPPQVTNPPKKLQSGFNGGPPAFTPPPFVPGGRKAGALTLGVTTECQAERFGANTKPFNDRTHPYCGVVPPVWTDAWHFTCPHCIDCPTTFKFTCPIEWETCELLVNLYVCPGCSSSGASQAVHGLWPSSLPADGWTAAAACSSSFCTENGKHSFVGFHKQIRGSETEELPQTATDSTMYFSFIVMEGHVCENINDATECADSPMCSWTGSACITDWCQRTAPGGGNPGSGCGACAPGTPEGNCTA
jgi:hypothetical protein